MDSCRNSIETFSFIIFMGKRLVAETVNSEYSLKLLD